MKAQEEQFELSPVSKKDSKDLVYKSNVLVNGKYDITMVQARFLVFVMFNSSLKESLFSK